MSNAPEQQFLSSWEWPELEVAGITIIVRNMPS